MNNSTQPGADSLTVTSEDSNRITKFLMKYISGEGLETYKAVQRLSQSKLDEAENFSYFQDYIIGLMSVSQRMMEAFRNTKLNGNTPADQIELSVTPEEATILAVDPTEALHMLLRNAQEVPTDATADEKQAAATVIDGIIAPKTEAELALANPEKASEYRRIRQQSREIAKPDMSGDVILAAKIRDQAIKALSPNASKAPNETAMEYNPELFDALLQGEGVSGHSRETHRFSDLSYEFLQLSKPLRERAAALAASPNQALGV